MTRTKAVKVPTASFADWAKLNADKIDEKQAETVQQEVQAVLEARKNEAKSKEAIGLHLRKIQEVLEPKHLFTASLKYFFNMSKATAYRYMELSEIAQVILPGPVFEAAIERGTRIRKDVIAQMPPPKTDDPEKISQYLDALDQQPQRRPQAALETDQEVLAKECVNFVGTRLDRLKANGVDTRTLKAFTKRVVSMILTKGGIEAEIKLAPVPIPEAFIVHRGAPRKEQSEPKAA